MMNLEADWQTCPPVQLYRKLGMPSASELHSVEVERVRPNTLATGSSGARLVVARDVLLVVAVAAAARGRDVPFRVLLQLQGQLPILSGQSLLLLAPLRFTLSAQLYPRRRHPAALVLLPCVVASLLQSLLQRITSRTVAHLPPDASQLVVVGFRRLAPLAVPAAAAAALLPFALLLPMDVAHPAPGRARRRPRPEPIQHPGGAGGVQVRPQEGARRALGGGVQGRGASGHEEQQRHRQGAPRQRHR
mmetsp:Transcript_12600/g.34314  ORF Transcript_12600/g.34314 Transcript_12600/m.34314 type:complete len:247 (+) Transcript_12600:188-928(+)